jgi:hypothetical protein
MKKSVKRTKAKLTVAQIRAAVEQIRGAKPAPGQTIAMYDGTWHFVKT